MRSIYVKRANSSLGDIAINLKCLNPNYESLAKITPTLSRTAVLAPSVLDDKICSDGECQWSLPNGTYRVLLNVVADLIPDAEAGVVDFEVEIEQNSSVIPTHGHSRNPSKCRAVTAGVGSTRKETFFLITVY